MIFKKSVYKKNLYSLSYPISIFREILIIWGLDKDYPVVTFILFQIDYTQQNVKEKFNNVLVIEEYHNLRLMK